MPKPEQAPVNRGLEKNFDEIVHRGQRLAVFPKLGAQAIGVTSDPLRRVENASILRKILDPGRLEIMARIDYWDSSAFEGAFDYHPGGNPINVAISQLSGLVSSGQEERRLRLVQRAASVQAAVQDRFQFVMNLFAIIDTHKYLMFSPLHLFTHYQNRISARAKSGYQTFSHTGIFSSAAGIKQQGRRQEA